MLETEMRPLLLKQAFITLVLGVCGCGLQGNLKLLKLRVTQFCVYGCAHPFLSFPGVPGTSSLSPARGLPPSTPGEARWSSYLSLCLSFFNIPSALTLKDSPGISCTWNNHAWRTFCIFPDISLSPLDKIVGCSLWLLFISHILLMLWVAPVCWLPGGRGPSASPMEPCLWIRGKESESLRAREGGCPSEHVAPQLPASCVLSGVLGEAIPASHQWHPSLSGYSHDAQLVPSLLGGFACCHLIRERPSLSPYPKSPSHHSWAPLILVYCRLLVIT